MTSEEEAIRREEERLSKAVNKFTYSKGNELKPVQPAVKNPPKPIVVQTSTKTEFSSERTLFSFDLKAMHDGEPEIQLSVVQTNDEVQISTLASVYDEKVTVLVNGNQIKFVCEREGANEKFKNTQGMQLPIQLAVESIYFTPLPQQGMKVHIKKHSN